MCKSDGGYRRPPGARGNSPQESSGQRVGRKKRLLASHGLLGGRGGEVKEQRIEAKKSIHKFRRAGSPRAQCTARRNRTVVDATARRAHGET